VERARRKLKRRDEGAMGEQWSELGASSDEVKRERERERERASKGVSVRKNKRELGCYNSGI
jgi:hypothetical protein